MSRKYKGGTITRSYAGNGQAQIVAQDGKGRWHLCDDEGHAERYIDYCETLPDPKPRDARGKSRTQLYKLERRRWQASQGWKSSITAKVNT